MRKAQGAAYRRQAQDEPAERLFFNLLDGLACDLEPMAPGAGQFSRSKTFILSFLSQNSESPLRQQEGA
jgi:hypothetical protein